MFRARHVKGICFIIILSVLLLGMCPTGMVADSLFASSRSHTVSQDATCTVLRATASTIAHTVSYTQETLPKYETTLTPVASSRRLNMRQGNSALLSIHEISDILSAHSIHSGNQTGYLFAEIYSNTIIISYIHHQDGAKA